MNSGRPDSVALAAHASELAEAVRTGSAVPMGRLYGLPELPDNDYWVDMAGVAALTGVRPKTITSWLTRGGPIRNPFPAPHRLLYRLYWPGSEIASWRTKEQDRAGQCTPPQ
jgi:predicted DNA-binding transcriptional regulator AlpA